LYPQGSGVGGQERLMVPTTHMGGGAVKVLEKKKPEKKRNIGKRAMRNVRQRGDLSTSKELRPGRNLLSRLSEEKGGGEK